MNKRRKYTTLNLEEKMKVLSRIEAGRSLKTVMDEFGISKSMFYDIKNKKLILDFVLKQDMPLVGAEKRRRTTGAKYGDIDDAVYTWYQQKCSSGVSVRGVELQAAAERFVKYFGHAIGNQKACGEQILGSASENVEPFWQKLSMIIKEEKLHLAQLYSGDETDLFEINKRYLPIREEDKQQLSALLCANADGTHKLKSVIIGKVKVPKSVKEDTSTLSVIYKPSQDVWFTRELFSEWFFQNFVPERNVLRFHEKNIRALLLLDSSPVHPSDGQIKCMFFPHGVILSCKQLYRWKQLEESLVIFGEKKEISKIKIYNVKSAIFNWAKSWDEVKQITIANAWENLYRKEPDSYLQGLEHGGNREILEKCGELETKLNDDMVWLDRDEEESCTLKPDKIKDTVQKGGAAKQTAEFKLSTVRDSLDYLLNFVDATPEFQRFHFTLKEMQQEIAKKDFLKNRPHYIKDTSNMHSGGN
uniref:HTH psq-type domain-containing protein n=1 Tax=Nannospalax galili TaxID=1026970 RepID=A0A8C6QQ26_NANGA